MAKNGQKPPNVLQEIENMLSQYVWVPDGKILPTALWILHTYVYDRYPVTPRLAILGPTNGVGKSTLIKLVQALANEPKRYINLTPALIYRLIESGGAITLLIDEADNMGLNILRNNQMRSILNGNSYGDNAGRASGTEGIKDYHCFAPIAIAAIGKLYLGLTRRSIIIEMQRNPSNNLKPFNPIDFAFRQEALGLKMRIEQWARTANLNPNPDNPVKNFVADNWRPLLAIADSFGCGDKARELAIEWSNKIPDVDKKAQLLDATRTIFEQINHDRIPTARMLEYLHRGEWSEWTGVDDERQPHRITAHELARILRDFGIQPKTVWEVGRFGRSSSKGYFAKDFEFAWAAYLPGKAAQRHINIVEEEEPKESVIQLLQKPPKKKRFKITKA